MFRVFKRYASSKGSKHMLKKNTPFPVFGIPGRYVSALFSAASEKNELEKVEEHLKNLQAALNRPTVKDFIDNNVISTLIKAKVMKEVGLKAGMPSTATNFLEIVAENGRMKMLRKMITLFLEVMVAHRKQALCEVITAEPLNDSTRSSLKKALENLTKGKNILLTEIVDPSIIGGMIVGIDDKHIDLSIAKRLYVYTELLKQPI